MQRHCREFLIEDDKAHPHVWRHARAIQLLESGELDVVRLKEFLGHHSLVNTLVYVINFQQAYFRGRTESEFEARPEFLKLIMLIYNKVVNLIKKL
jgi:integrase